MGCVAGLALTAITGTLHPSDRLAVTTRIPDTADRGWGNVAALMAQSSAMGRITSTLTRRRRILTENGCAKFGTTTIALWTTRSAGTFGPVPMPGEGGAYAAYA